MIQQRKRKLNLLIFFLQVHLIFNFHTLVNGLVDSQPLQLKIGASNDLFDLSSLVLLNKEICVNGAAKPAPMLIVKNGAIIAKAKFNYQNDTVFPCSASKLLFCIRCALYPRSRAIVISGE